LVDSLGHGLLLPCRPEFGGLLSDELDLLLAVSLLVVLSPFVDVLLTILQHSIDESGKPMSHGCDGFGAPSSLRKRRYCAPRYVWLRSKVEAPSRNAVTARLTTWRVPRASTLFLLRPAVRHSFSSVLIPVLLRGNEDPVRPVDERLKKLSNEVKGPLHPGPCHQTSYRPYRSHAYRQARSAISHIGLSLPIESWIRITKAGNSRQVCGILLPTCAVPGQTAPCAAARAQHHMILTVPTGMR